jgi:hypothetical protein
VRSISGVDAGPGRARGVPDEVAARQSGVDVEAGNAQRMVVVPESGSILGVVVVVGVGTVGGKDLFRAAVGPWPGVAAMQVGRGARGGGVVAAGRHQFSVDGEGQRVRSQLIVHGEGEGGAPLGDDNGPQVGLRCACGPVGKRVRRAKLAVEAVLGVAHP